MVTKGELSERRRGRGGSIVRLRTPYPLWGDTAAALGITIPDSAAPAAPKATEELL